MSLFKINFHITLVTTTDFRLFILACFFRNAWQIFFINLHIYENYPLHSIGICTHVCICTPVYVHSYLMTQNFDSEKFWWMGSRKFWQVKFDELLKNCLIFCQYFPPSKFCAIQYMYVRVLGLVKINHWFKVVIMCIKF